MNSRHVSVATPWRSSQELLHIRQALYSSDLARRERAVNKIFAWRTRKVDGLPLLLDSTADIVDVIIQDEKCVLQHNALQLLYATALSRFITGLADTQIDLTRDRPSWFPSGKTIQLPLHLFEIRHRIVHRHLPSLSELKRAAQQSLEWLWEWYWSQLDYAFGVKSIEEEVEVESIEAIREKLQAILRAYVKDRKNEIKARRKISKAAVDALTTMNLRYGSNVASAPSSRVQTQLLQLLVDEKMILPADKKIGSSMSGAFMIWTPILLALTQSRPPLVLTSTLLQRLLGGINTSPSTVHTSIDPIRQALCEWITHILTAKDWQQAHSTEAQKSTNDILISCFSNPTHWNIILAEKIIEHETSIANKNQWLDILQAAKSEGSVEETDIAEHDVGVKQGGEVKREVKEKIRGPTKYIGLWKERPIGWMEGDE